MEAAAEETFWRCFILFLEKLGSKVLLEGRKEDEDVSADDVQRNISGLVKKLIKRTPLQQEHQTGSCQRT